MTIKSCRGRYELSEDGRGGVEGGVDVDVYVDDTTRPGIGLGVRVEYDEMTRWSL